MPKYRVNIEFTTDKPLKFPHDAKLLNAMEVQLEALGDGDYGKTYAYTVEPCTITDITLGSNDIQEAIENRIQELKNILHVHSITPNIPVKLTITATDLLKELEHIVAHHGIKA